MDATLTYGTDWSLVIGVVALISVMGALIYAAAVYGEKRSAPKPLVGPDNLETRAREWQ